MPRIRTMRYVTPSYQAAEVLELRMMLSASSKKAPIAESSMQGTVDVDALGFSENITAQATVTGTLAVGKTLTVAVTIDPPGDPLTSPIKASAKSKVLSIDQNGNLLTVTMQAPKKSLKIPVSVGGRTVKLTVTPKSQPLVLVINTETKEVVSFGISYTVKPIPGLTNDPTDVNVSLFAFAAT